MSWKNSPLPHSHKIEKNYSSENKQTWHESLIVTNNLSQVIYAWRGCKRHDKF